MSLKKLVSKVTKENLWLFILAELSRRPMYAYEIARVIREKYRIPTAKVTTYVVLYSMKREGLIEKRIKSPSLSNPSRKYYGITEKGLKVLGESLAFLRGILENLTMASQPGEEASKPLESRKIGGEGYEEEAYVRSAEKA
ncbi:MAG: PadR family transcriptional regulator [Candidatus Hecatellales archaeon]|nr:MAG: PadR family transcriptional regulator [Candidatus Hecatellales archaeon]